MKRTFSGEHAARDRDDGGIGGDGAVCRLHAQSWPAAVDAPHRAAEHDRHARGVGGDHRPVALDHPEVHAAVVVAAEIAGRYPVELAPRT